MNLLRLGIARSCFSEIHYCNVAITKNDKLLCSYSAGQVEVWDIKDMNDIKKLNPYKLPSDVAIDSIAVTKDSTRLICCCSGTIWILNLMNGLIIAPFRTGNKINVQALFGTVELLNIDLEWNNIVGEKVSQTNQVYFEVTPAP
jgi:hypothetical protein